MRVYFTQDVKPNEELAERAKKAFECFTARHRTMEAGIGWVDGDPTKSFIVATWRKDNPNSLIIEVMNDT